MGSRADIYKTNHTTEADQMPKTQSQVHHEGNAAERQLGSQESLLDLAWDPKARVSNKNQVKMRPDHYPHRLTTGSDMLFSYRERHPVAQAHRHPAWAADCFALIQFKSHMHSQTWQEPTLSAQLHIYWCLAGVYSTCTAHQDNNK